MASVRYIAKRSLTGGVTASQTVTYELPIRYAGLSRTRQPQAITSRSLAGLRETYYYNAEQSWRCSSIPLSGFALEQLVMFLDSVEDGQEFEFDPEGAAAWREVYIEPGYDETREPVADSLKTISFTIIERP